MTWESFCGEAGENGSNNITLTVPNVDLLGLHYLRQYTEPAGYLLIYKTCEEQLVIEGDGQIGTIPFVRCDGRTIFVLVVDICEYGKAVSQRVFEPVRITASEFTKAVSPPLDTA